MMVFTSFAVTHPNILPSHRSSMPHGTPSQQMEMLPYRSVVSKKTPCHWQEERWRRRRICAADGLLAGQTGLEPVTAGFGDQGSTVELLTRKLL